MTTAIGGVSLYLDEGTRVSTRSRTRGVPMASSASVTSITTTRPTFSTSTTPIHSLTGALHGARTSATQSPVEKQRHQRKLHPYARSGIRQRLQQQEESERGASPTPLPLSSYSRLDLLALPGPPSSAGDSESVDEDSEMKAGFLSQPITPQSNLGPSIITGTSKNETEQSIPRGNAEQTELGNKGQSNAAATNGQQQRGLNRSQTRACVFSAQTDTLPTSATLNSPSGTTRSHVGMTSVADGRVSSTRTQTTEVNQGSQQPQQEQQHPRAASPTPTEIDEPDSDQLATLLSTHSIKIRDFANEPWRTYPVKTANTITYTTPTPELFDQYEGMAEFEYRVRQWPRIYPIRGNTLIRLLEIGWVTPEEVRRRCAKMDYEELKAVGGWPGLVDLEQDDDDRGEGPSAQRESSLLQRRPAPYPYILRWKGVRTRPPIRFEDRMVVMENRKFSFMKVDRMRRMLEFEMARNERERAEAERALKLIEARWRKEREKMLAARAREVMIRSDTDIPLSLKAKGKRPFEEGSQDEAEEAKRRRMNDDEFEALSVEDELLFVPDGCDFDDDDDTLGPSQNDYVLEADPFASSYSPTSFSQLDLSKEPWSQEYWDKQPGLVVPQKQYPAPLETYDPELYPEARAVIESQDRVKVEPMGPSHVKKLERADTPPLDEESQGLGLHGFGGTGVATGGKGLAPGAGNPNRGLKRTLSRTQTFTQL